MIADLVFLAAGATALWTIQHEVRRLPGRWPRRRR